MAKARSELFEAIPFELKDIKEIEHTGPDGTKERLMQVTGVMHRADELNGNHRIYPSQILSREVNKLKERLASGDTVFSQADHPADGTSRIGDTAAMLKRLEYTPQNEVIGTAVILPTQKGKDLAAIVRAGGKVTIIVRGFGTTQPGECAGQRGDVVQEDYELVTYDFVIGQSLRNCQIPEPVVASTGRRLTVKQQKFANFLIGAANGNQTLACRLAGYRGGPAQLATQGAQNMRNPEIRQMINEALDALVVPSLKTLATGLEATRRRAFVTKEGEIRYTEAEPDQRVRVYTANKILDRHERSSTGHAGGSDADVITGHNESEEPQREVADDAKTGGCANRGIDVAQLDPADRVLFEQATEIEAELAEVDRELDDGGHGEDK